MTNRKGWGRACAVPREAGVYGRTQAPQHVYVDTANCAPAEMAAYRIFNPFDFAPSRIFPVPGQQLQAHSVESIWQGLKVVDGETDFAMFKSVPRKRPSPETRLAPTYKYQESVFLYGTTLIDLIAARVCIYLPTYLYLLEHHVPSSVIDDLFATLAAGRDVVCFDWDANHNIFDPTDSFSHSAILAAWLNGTLEGELLVPGRQLVAAHIESPLSIEELPLTRYRTYHES